MNKPLILREEDFKSELMGVINKYVNDIPAVHMTYILKETNDTLNDIAKKQLDVARKQYSESEVEDNG